MPDIPRIFAEMPNRYRKGVLKSAQSFYFSVGDHKYTVHLAPDGCEVEKGRTVDNADVVLKTTPALFEKMVIKGEMPSMMDIARGKIKTNDPASLKQLRDLFTV